LSDGIGKNYGIKMAQRNFEAKIVLSYEARSELIWWKKNILIPTRSILHNPIMYQICTDISKLGWGPSSFELG